MNKYIMPFIEGKKLNSFEQAKLRDNLGIKLINGKWVKKLN